ncbi:hypothetical protein AMAG_06147 [Allomyces macrogynus ATCC 38327]|uniref:Uncharacterized protein n=1 Tax=Allomyces macrogynus (strain ATCC 38327) TaxID=578462 RepID=A0A0L0SEH3_ALLM3|nr:hypothetical protein AMAG_06147 [Allomyces macrogynus ATCC 38327]|eukprot:KNE60790.1 hypothetical protein AMAG_06147 [Allomyces macrogynus ATCC 38327]
MPAAKIYKRGRGKNGLEVSPINTSYRVLSLTFRPSKRVNMTVSDSPVTVSCLASDRANKITIVNDTSASLDVFVSKYSGGSDEWFSLARGASDTWQRGSGLWEAVVVRQDSKRMGLYVQSGSQVTVHCVNRDNKGIHVAQGNGKNENHISVLNYSSVPVQVYVTKYSNDRGSDEWFQLGTQTSDSWARPGWEMVVVKSPLGEARTGAYARAGDLVVFNG